MIVIYINESHKINVPNILSYNYNNRVYKKVAQEQFIFLCNLVPFNELFKANWILAFLHEL